MSSRNTSYKLHAYIWLQRDPIHGGRLQAHLWLARHKRASRPQIQHNSARTGRFDRPRYPAHVERTRAIHAEGCSRHMAIPSAEAGWRLLLKACSEHRRGGETGAAQQEGEGKGIAHALPRMLGRGRARTLIILSACATLYPQRRRGPRQAGRQGPPASVATWGCRRVCTYVAVCGEERVLLVHDWLGQPAQVTLCVSCGDAIVHE